LNRRLSGSHSYSGALFILRSVKMVRTVFAVTKLALANVKMDRGRTQQFFACWMYLEHVRGLNRTAAAAAAAAAAAFVNTAHVSGLQQQ